MFLVTIFHDLVLYQHRLDLIKGLKIHFNCYILLFVENNSKKSLGRTKPQFSSVAQSCPTLCDPMNHSTPGLPVHHQLLEFTQTHVHWAGDAIQPSHPLPSPSPPAPNPSQHQGLFHWVNSSREVAKVLEFQLQHQSFQWTPRTDLLQDGLVGSPWFILEFFNRGVKYSFVLFLLKEAFFPMPFDYLLIRQVSFPGQLSFISLSCSYLVLQSN